MNTLIIYDEEGYVLYQAIGNYRVPVGVPFLEIEIQPGQRLVGGIGVDVTTTPHQPIFEDIPKTETELLQQKIDTMQAALDELILGGL